VLLLTLAGTAFAQLSAADLEAMKERGEREGWTFTVGENEATGRSLDELCGLVPPEDWWVDAKFDPCTPSRDLPSSYDWRDYGCCPSVKNQGGCGSCWAFATVGPLECNIQIIDGIEVNLSEQWLVSCNQHGWGCGGGWWAHDYHEFRTDPCNGTGAVMEAEFPYVAWKAPCNCPYSHEYLIDDWAYVGSGARLPPTNAIKQALLDYGPLTVGVAVDGEFQAYNGGVFNDCWGGGVNHGVTLVGWDDNQGTNGVWIIRNSWGPWWGEDGYMRIEYGCSSIGYASAYVVYSGRDPFTFVFPDGMPKMLTPEQPTAFTVQIQEVYAGCVPGSVELYYRYDGGIWKEGLVLPLGGYLYEAHLPAASCGDVPEFYLTGESELGGTVYGPSGAPDFTYLVGVGTLVAHFADNFETDTGWTVENTITLNDGAWERGIPAGGGERGDPPTDYDGSGQCYLTGNEYGDSDVDSGTTWLTSPPLETDIGDAQVHYAVWYTNDAGPNPDNNLFKTYLSNDAGATWMLAETIGPETESGWVEHTMWLGDYLPLTDLMMIRFEVSEVGTGAIIEAGVDDFRLSWVQCVPYEAVPPLPEDSLRLACIGDEECANAATCIEGLCYAPKNRYLSMSPNPENAGKETARRVSVKLGSGESTVLGWMGPPSADGISRVQASPEYRDWSLDGPALHVSDCEIAPVRTYLVQTIEAGEDIGDEAKYSEPLQLPTMPVWGDLVGTCPDNVCTPGQGVVNLDDIMAGIGRFQGVDNAPICWLDVDPSDGDSVPNELINLGDILTVVSCFQGQAYPGDGPLGCP
jgi:hypothetical protein